VTIAVTLIGQTAALVDHVTGRATSAARAEPAAAGVISTDRPG
jgi:hypothetical protein